LFIVFPRFVFPENKDNVITAADLQKVKDSISEIRRDELNYKIEKDLLKETFASNYQTINIVLAIVLGLFTVIGVLGIKDIAAVKKDYLNELDNLNKLRKDFELKIDKNLSETEEVKKTYIKLTQTNEEQNNRIKILEMQEKASSLMKSHNYRRALEYISVALELDKTNYILLIQKATCLWKLDDLRGAAEVYKSLIDIDQTNEGAVVNLMELYLLLNQLDDYRNLYSQYKSIVEIRGSETGVKYYFNVLDKYQSEKYDELKTLVGKYIDIIPPGKEKRINWLFDDALKYLDSKPVDIGKRLMQLFINIANGNTSTDEAKTEITKINI
jgi:tetratricopeptide (TPR) repeat protein